LFLYELLKLSNWLRNNYIYILQIIQEGNSDKNGLQSFEHYAKIKFVMKLAQRG